MDRPGCVTIMFNTLIFMEESGVCQALRGPRAAAFTASWFLWSKNKARHLPASVSSSARQGGPRRMGPPPDGILQEIRSADGPGGVLQTVKGCAQGAGGTQVATAGETVVRVQEDFRGLAAFSVSVRSGRRPPSTRTPQPRLSGAFSPGQETVREKGNKCMRLSTGEEGYRTWEEGHRSWVGRAGLSEEAALQSE